MKRYIEVAEIMSFLKNYERFEIVQDLINRIENLPTIEVSEDCISRANLRRSLARPLEINNADEMYWKGWHDCTVAVETRIEDAPSVVPTVRKNRQVERVEGEWLLDGRCSECLVSPLTTHKNYCPNCGADMRGEQDG